MGIYNKLDEYFGLTKYDTNIRIEVLAGISTYLSLAYIFVVNPAILAEAGMDKSAVLFATVVASGLSTLAMGIWARLPFALAPGLEMNGFFAYVVVGGAMGLTWQQGLGVIFWSGVLCFILTLVPARQKIIDSIPIPLKIGIGFSVGAFVLTIGLKLSGILTFDDTSGIVTGIGSIFSKEAILLYVGLIVAVVLGLKRLNFIGGMLVSIIVATIIARTWGIVPDSPAKISPDMNTYAGQLDWFGLFDAGLKAVPVFIVLFLIDFYGSIGKFIGLTAATKLQENGEVKNIEKAMYVDGIGTSFGAWLGTTSIITYVESAVGIAAGGRTGITAIVCGILMLLSLAFAPLVGLVPVVAATGILAYVGYLLFPIAQVRSGEIDFSKIDLFVSIAMAAITLLTFSIDKALLVGFIYYLVRSFVNKTANVYLAISTVFLVFSIIARSMLQGHF